MTKPTIPPIVQATIDALALLPPPAPPPANPKLWYWAHDRHSEACRGPCDTRAQALAKAMVETAVGERITLTFADKKMPFPPDAAQIVENHIEHLDNDGLGGEDSIGETMDDTAAAEAELDALIGAWWKRHGGAFGLGWVFDDYTEETVRKMEDGAAKPVSEGYMDAMDGLNRMNRWLKSAGEEGSGTTKLYRIAEPLTAPDEPGWVTGLVRGGRLIDEPDGFRLHPSGRQGKFGDWIMAANMDGAMRLHIIPNTGPVVE